MLLPSHHMDSQCSSVPVPRSAFLYPSLLPLGSWPHAVTATALTKITNYSSFPNPIHRSLFLSELLEVI